ncbi:hypothetical protein M3Y99_00441200 [Aphelenchoides fujianensis]|nr:hypothetical protein M3Y99_00441200 [Aphelenchoides fujianensis]
MYYALGAVLVFAACCLCYSSSGSAFVGFRFLKGRSKRSTARPKGKKAAVDLAQKKPADRKDAKKKLAEPKARKKPTGVRKTTPGPAAKKKRTSKLKTPSKQPKIKSLFATEATPRRPAEQKSERSTHERPSTRDGPSNRDEESSEVTRFIPQSQSGVQPPPTSRFE